MHPPSAERACDACDGARGPSRAMLRLVSCAQKQCSPPTPALVLAPCSCRCHAYTSSVHVCAALLHVAHKVTTRALYMRMRTRTR
eukprot:952141-Pyramimonas_sp.AAC.1